MTTRRQFLKRSVAGGLALGLPRLARSAAPNDQVRIAILGMGGLNVVGGVGGRGRQLAARFRDVPGVTVAALCDVDRAILDHEVQQFRDRGESVVSHTDLRKVLEDRTIDAVAVALPNHWHALATIWACQAGKDVYVEKPFSYSIDEGPLMIAAARKHRRMVQVGTQRRSSECLRRAFEYLRSGQVGPIRCARALVYRARDGIGKVSAPTAIPASVDYDLWCGPAPKSPLLRKQLHYDWHWFWETGNGEIANNGAHLIDVCRWALGQDGPAPRAMSLGGRFGFGDDGQTANTQIAVWDYQPAPLICEVRNLASAKKPGAIGRFRDFNRGVVIDCEGGCFAGDMNGGTVFDRQGRKIQEIHDGHKPNETETAHAANFIAAVRSRKAEGLHAEALVGHVSATCCHMANLSHRLGTRAAPAAIREAIGGNRELVEAFERCREYLKINGVDLETTHATVGPWLTFDGTQGRFTGPCAGRANELCQRAYRAPFTLPSL